MTLLVTLSACGEETGSDEAESCQLNSDCSSDERCEAGRCVSEQSQAECDGGDCGCLRDEQCPTESFCELATGRCQLVECKVNSDCEVGLTCLGSRYVVDLEIAKT